MGAVSPLSPAALHSARTVTVHLGLSWRLGDSAGTLCVLRVCPAAGGVRSVRSGAVGGWCLLGRGCPLYAAGSAKNVPPLMVLWPTGKAFTAS